MRIKAYATALRRYAQSSISCLYLMGGGFLRAKHRPLLYRICDHFGFEKELSLQRPCPKARVPGIAIEDLLGTNTTVTLAQLTAVDGNVSPLELVLIASLVRKQAPVLSFEIGTFDGRTTLNMALNQNQGTETVTLDLPAAEIESVATQLEESDKKYVLKQRSGSRFVQTHTPARILQLYGDSAKYNFTDYRGRVDLMFIDGSHRYEYVVGDSHTALSLVRRGGVILWHDYGTPCWPGVTQALNELYAHDPGFCGLRHILGTSLCILWNGD